MFKIFMVTTAVLAGSYSTANPIDAGAQINNHESEIHPDGSYSYHFDTTNGIAAQESGVGGHSVGGSSSYYNPDGQLVQLTYTADEFGFQPQGDHLPTSPPIPDYIQRALEYIRTHPPHEDQTKYHNHHEQEHHEQQHHEEQHHERQQHEQQQQHHQQQYHHHEEQHQHQQHYGAPVYQRRF